MEIIEPRHSEEGCIFCQIAEGKVPSKKVYEDDDIIAVMDIKPANPGHLLIMPKSHHAVMPQVPDYLISKMAVVTKMLSNHMLKVLGVKGTTVFIANGPLAGQRAPHFMLHLIPRLDGDGLPLALPVRQTSEAEIESIKSRIESAIKSRLGSGTAEMEKKEVEKEPVKTEKETRNKEVKAEFSEGETRETEDESKKEAVEERDAEESEEETEASEETEETGEEGEEKKGKKSDKGIDIDLISRFFGGS